MSPKSPKSAVRQIDEQIRHARSHVRQTARYIAHVEDLTHRIESELVVARVVLARLEGSLDRLGSEDRSA